MKNLILLLLLIATLNAQNLNNNILEYISTHPAKEQFKLWHFAFQAGYDLNSELALQKYRVFKDNLKLIKETNAKNLGYTLGLGPFTDLTFDEFSNTYLKLTPPSEVSTPSEEKKLSFDELADDDDDTPFVRDGDDDAPFVRFLQEQGGKKSKDHRALYPKVKDQSFCGSCWAFGTIGAIEGQALLQGKAVTLAEQQLVDCNRENFGCNGGWYDSAFAYAIKNQIYLESNYPYRAREGNCKKLDSKAGVKVGGLDYCSKYRKRCTINETFRLLDKGPAAVAIEVRADLAHYKQGNWYSPRCRQVNHAVIMLYLETDDASGSSGKITIRNSWGDRWGNNGQGVLIYNHRTMAMPACGLLEHAYVPTDVVVTTQ